jgi:hypothetical protein
MTHRVPITVRLDSFEGPSPLSYPKPRIGYFKSIYWKNYRPVFSLRQTHAGFEF